MIPVIKNKINGIPPVGEDLRPTSNTNQYTAMVTVGCIKAHIIPKNDPAYRDLKSFIENFWISFRFAYKSLI
jgi:hypothetical protein